MKYLIILLLGVTIFTNTNAQTDPLTTGLTVTPSTIAVGQTADFSFTIANLGGGSSTDSNPIGSVEAVLSLPSTIAGAPNHYSFQSFISPTPTTGTTATGPIFDWVYDAVDNVIIGTNRVPFLNFTSEVLTVRVIGTNMTIASGATSVLNIQVSAGSGNNTANDNGSVPLIVTGVLAVSLTDVTSTASDCSAKIAWSTVREDAGSTFDIEYSPDGARFVKVGTVAGRSATGSKYDFSYSQGNGKGFYRLKIGSATGEVTYSKVVNVTTKCNEKKVFIYPNPIQNLQDLHVNITNFAGAVNGNLINAAGQIIFTKKLVNGANLVKIENLAEGIYTFKVTDEAKEVQNFKIVVVK